MINFEYLNDVNETMVLMEMGRQLMKESCYICNSGETEVFTEASKVNIFRRAFDFVKRPIVKFLAWLKKGNLKKIRERLEKLIQNPRKNNMYQNDNDLREVYTYVYSPTFINNTLNPTVEAFMNLDLVRIINSGNVRNFDRSAMDRYISELTQMERNFKKITTRMTGVGPSRIDRLSTNQVKLAIKGTIKWCEFCETGVYNELQHCYEAIKIVQKDEKEINLGDSKDISQQYTRALTVMGECYLHIMTVCQKIAELYLTGASKRTMSKKDKTKGSKNLTVREIYDALRDENNDAATNGVYLSMTKLDDEHFRVDVYYKTSSGTWRKSKNPIPCDQITNAARSYIANHSNQSSALKPGDLS